MNTKKAVEDLVNMCIDSYNLILKGNFPATVADEVHIHLKQCLQVIDLCTVQPHIKNEDLSSDTCKRMYNEEEIRLLNEAIVKRSLEGANVE